jgi:hypothetical protein
MLIFGLSMGLVVFAIIIYKSGKGGDLSGISLNQTKPTSQPKKNDGNDINFVGDYFDKTAVDQHEGKTITPTGINENIKNTQSDNTINCDLNGVEVKEGTVNAGDTCIPLAQ